MEPWVNSDVGICIEADEDDEANKIPETPGTCIELEDSFFGMLVDDFDLTR